MTKYFTEYNSQFSICNDVELMCHPTIDMSTGCIVDSMTGKKLNALYSELISYKDL